MTGQRVGSYDNDKKVREANCTIYGNWSHTLYDDDTIAISRD